MQSYNSVSFYIVAHQDDWQLFMTPNAYEDFCNRQRKVVFIYTTAGDAGKDQAYWSAREHGALHSVQFALDTRKSPPQTINATQKTCRGHTLQCYEYKNSMSYFMRLPDGRMTGKGSEIHRHESLTKLHKGHISTMTAIDKSTTYQGWDDFCQTLAEIIKVESQDCSEGWVNASDYLLTNNFVDNADHTATGIAVKTAVKLLGDKFAITFYRDYDVDLLPPNLTPTQVLWKTSLFVAYDVAVQSEVNHCTRCESAYYMSWCLRQYARQAREGYLVSVIGHLWVHWLRRFARLRRWAGSSEEAITYH